MTTNEDVMTILVIGGKIANATAPCAIIPLAQDDLLLYALLASSTMAKFLVFSVKSRLEAARGCAEFV